MITETVNIKIAALKVIAVTAVITEYRETEGIVVYDLFDTEGILVAKSRYSLLADIPFSLTQEEIVALNPVIEESIN